MAHKAKSLLNTSELARLIKILHKRATTSNYNYHYTNIYESNASDRDSYQCWQETINHNMNIKWVPGEIQWDKGTWFFSRDSCACQHTSPRCVDHTLGGSVANRCFTNLAQHMGAAKTYPYVRVTQWYEQFTRVTLWLFAGRAQDPSQDHRSWPRTITNMFRSSTVAPSRIGGGNYQELQENYSSNDLKCH